MMHIRNVLFICMTFCYSGIITTHPYIWIKNDYPNTIFLTINDTTKELSPGDKVQLSREILTIGGKTVQQVWPKTISIKEKGSLNPFPHKGIADWVKKLENKEKIDNIKDFEATIVIYDSGDKAYFGYKFDNVKKLTDQNKSIEQKFFDKNIDVVQYFNAFAEEHKNDILGKKALNMKQDYLNMRKNYGAETLKDHSYVTTLNKAINSEQYEIKKLIDNMKTALSSWTLKKVE